MYNTWSDDWNFSFYSSLVGEKEDEDECKSDI